MASAPPAALVGREREVGLLGAALANARLRRGGLVAITGEAGIGKTRLAEEATRRADQDGFATAWGSAWGDGGAPPLWPWHDLLTQLGTGDADELLALRQPGDAERFVRFRAVTAEMRRLAADRPLLLVIDDLPAADPAAALLARFAARSLRQAAILLVVTARDGRTARPSDDAVSALIGESTRLALTGLDRATVARVVADDGRGFDADALSDLTGGNPLLLHEALAAGAPDDLRVPGPVRRLLLQRLTAVPRPRRQVLAAAAVLGPSADDATIAALAGVDVPAVREVREVARSVGFVRREDERRFVFAHTLLREALLDERGAEAVAHLHARAAAVIATSPGDAAERLGRIATHLLTAAHAGAARPEQAIAAAREAARAESTRGGHEPAARLLRSALGLVDGGGAPELWLQLAQAELAGGRLRASRAAFLEALPEADADPVTTAEAAIGLGGIWVFEHRDLDGIDRFLGIISRAISGLGEQRRDLVARLRARLAAERVYLGTGEVDDVRAEVAVLRASGDAPGLAHTLSLLHHVLLGPHYAAERTAVADELVTVAAGTGDTVLVLMGALWRTVDCFLAGEPEAERNLAALRQRADALRVDAVLYIVELMDVMLAVRAGRLAEAEAGAARCFTRGGEVGDADAVGYYGAQLLGIRWLQGRGEEMLPLAREIAGSPTIVPTHRIYPAAVAALAADTGGAATEEAWRNLDGLRTAGIGDIPSSSNWLLTLFCIVEAADRLGDPASAEAAYKALCPFAGLPVMASLAVMCFGSAEGALGLAARTLGRLDDAVRHLERAIEADRRLGNRPMLAIARGNLGATLLLRRQGDDAARGTSLLEEAVAALRGMGLTARAERFAPRQPDVAAGPPGTLRFAGGTWELCCGSDRVVLPDGVGIRYLARLVAVPGRDVGADELAGTGADALRQEVLDDDARRDYRRRMEHLRAELDAADAAGDPQRATRAQDELDRLMAELAASTGLGGRARTFADGRERARTAVQKAIRRAVARIGESTPVLGELLAASVQTGLVCRFDPVEGLPREWQVEGPSWG
jgi:tetratricopeptide (TPR) repeat protein